MPQLGLHLSPCTWLSLQAVRVKGEGETDMSGEE